MSRRRGCSLFPQHLRNGDKHCLRIIFTPVAGSRLALYENSFFRSRNSPDVVMNEPRLWVRKIRKKARRKEAADYCRKLCKRVGQFLQERTFWRVSECTFVSHHGPFPVKGSIWLFSIISITQFGCGVGDQRAVVGESKCYQEIWRAHGRTTCVSSVVDKKEQSASMQDYCG